MVLTASKNVTKSGPTSSSFGICQRSNQASECASMKGRMDAIASSGLRATTTYCTSGPSPGSWYGRSPGDEWVLNATPGVTHVVE